MVFEHPLNERVRTYLRLEYLFRRFEWLLQHEHPIEHHLDRKSTRLNSSHT